MTGKELRERRLSLGLSQADFAKRLDLSRDYIGQLERDVTPINRRIAAAVRELTPTYRRKECDEDWVLRKLSSDPMEYIIETALINADIEYEKERQLPGTQYRLDFYLPDQDLYIEVKQFHSERAASQLGSYKNVILAQGRPAVEFLAHAIRSFGIAKLPITSHPT